MRPTQWIKNTFVLVPMFLNGQLTDLKAVVFSAVAFVLFCLTSSSIYCINDAVDAPYDAVNPDKCHRPVASGEISRRMAISIAAVLLALVVALTMSSGYANIRELLIVLLSYFILNLLYTLWLKTLPVADMLIIAICFLLRIVAGGVACGIHITKWTMLLVFLLTLMLAMGKRHHEAWLCEEKGIKSRSNIGRYNVHFLNIALIVSGTVTLCVYIGWTFTSYALNRFGTHDLFISSIPVAIGIWRYLWIIIKKNGGGNPTKLLLSDRYLQATVVLWIIYFFIILYRNVI